MNKIHLLNTIYCRNVNKYVILVDVCRPPSLLVALTWWQCWWWLKWCPWGDADELHLVWSRYQALQRAVKASKLETPNQASGISAPTGVVKVSSQSNHFHDCWIIIQLLECRIPLLRNFWFPDGWGAWVTRLERLKGANTKSKGPIAKIRGRRSFLTSSHHKCHKKSSQRRQ